MTTQQAAKTIRYESTPTRHMTVPDHEVATAVTIPGHEVATVSVPGHEVAAVTVASHEVPLRFIVFEEKFLRMSKDGFIVMGLTPCSLFEVVLRPG